jgi:hypothetical protein
MLIIIEVITTVLHLRTMKALYTVGILLLVFNGISALAGGSSLILDPTGKTLGMPMDLLNQTIFKSFLIPGILLYVFNGLLSILISIAAIFKIQFYDILISIQGYVSLTWIIIQVLIIGDIVVLHYVYGAIAIILIIVGFLLKPGQALTA